MDEQTELQKWLSFAEMYNWVDDEDESMDEEMYKYRKSVICCAAGANPCCTPLHRHWAQHAALRVGRLASCS